MKTNRFLYSSTIEFSLWRETYGRRLELSSFWWTDVLGVYPSIKGSVIVRGCTVLGCRPDLFCGLHQSYVSTRWHLDTDHTHFTSCHPYPCCTPCFAYQSSYCSVHNCHVSCDLSVFVYTGHTQKNGAVLIVFTIKTAPFFCVCPVYDR
jgi:hypothetical protein